MPYLEVICPYCGKQVAKRRPFKTVETAREDAESRVIALFEFMNKVKVDRSKVIRVEGVAVRVLLPCEEHKERFLEEYAA